jgi:hypothetical protein
MFWRGKRLPTMFWQIVITLCARASSVDALVRMTAWGIAFWARLQTPWALSVDRDQRGVIRKVYTAGQKRRVTEQIKRDFKRRSAIEPVIGHLKDDHRMGRNHLAHSTGDAINAVLAAAGYNFRRLIQWLRFLLLRLLIAFARGAQFRSA